MYTKISTDAGRVFAIFIDVVPYDSKWKIRRRRDDKFESRKIQESALLPVQII